MIENSDSRVSCVNQSRTTNHESRLVSGPRPGEFLHEVDALIHAVLGHRVVKRRTHATDRAMALEPGHAGRLRPLEEFGTKLGIRERGRPVHPRTNRLADRVTVEVLPVDVVVHPFAISRGGPTAR